MKTNNSMIKKLCCYMLMFCLSVTSLLVSPEAVSAKAQKNAVKFSVKKLTLFVGEQYTVPMKLPKSKAQLKKVKYSVNNKAVAKVAKSGLITAKTKGKANITATYKKSRTVLKLNVKKKPKKRSLTLSSYSVKLNVGQTTVLKPNVKGVSTKRVKYKSNNPRIASVSSKGLVKGKAAGSAKITVQSAVNKKLKKVVTVTVAKQDNGGDDGKTPTPTPDPEPTPTPDPEPSVTPQDPSVTPQEPSVTPQEPDHKWTHESPEPDKDGYIDAEESTPDGHIHSFGMYIEVKKPTCTETGLSYKQCQLCGGKSKLIMHALGHLYVGGICQNCGDIIDDIEDSIQGIKDGGLYTVGQQITKPESGKYLLNGEEIEYENDVFYITDAGDYKLVYVNDSGEEEAEVSFSVKEDSVLTFDALMENGAYPVGTTIFKPAMAALTINDKPVNESYTFERDGDYTLRMIDADGNVTVYTIVVKHMHKYTESVYASESTCQTAGVTITKCSMCEATREVQLPLAPHKFANPVVTKEPTCEETGIRTGVCTVCHETTEETIPATGHAWSEYVVTQEPDCLRAGIKTATCANCSETKIDSVAALGHDFGDFVVDVEETCTDDGVKSKHCSRCDIKSEITTIPAKGHDWELTDKVDASCKEPSTDTYTCKVCGETDIRHETDALGHDFKKTNTIDATCKSPSTDTYVCDRCGETEERHDTEALGHDFSEEYIVDKEATCEEEGQESRHCLRCDEVTDVRAIPVTGHAFEKTNTVAATCENASVDTYVCSVCGTTEERHDTEPLGHEFATEFTVDVQPSCTTTGSKSKHCTRCDKKSEVTEIDALGHDYAETFTVDTSATCTIAGSQSKHCSRCAATTDVTPILALGHDYPANYTTASAATCTTAGSKYRDCTRCGSAGRDTQSIAALGHAYTSTYTTDKSATCTVAGSKSRHCSRCTAKTDVTAIAALGHSYPSTYTTTKAATCTAAGSKYRDCARCGSAGRDTQTIAALGHNYSTTYTVDKAATCTESGTRSKHCTRCASTTGTQTIPAKGHSYAQCAYSNDCGDRGTVSKCSGCGDIRSRTITSRGTHSWQGSLSGKFCINCNEVKSEWNEACDAGKCAITYNTTCDGLTISNITEQSGNAYAGDFIFDTTNDVCQYYNHSFEFNFIDETIPHNSVTVNIVANAGSGINKTYTGYVSSIADGIRVYVALNDIQRPCSGKIIFQFS